MNQISLEINPNYLFSREVFAVIIVCDEEQPENLQATDVLPLHNLPRVQDNPYQIRYSLKTPFIFDSLSPDFKFKIQAFTCEGKILANKNFSPNISASSRSKFGKTNKERLKSVMNSVKIGTDKTFRKIFSRNTMTKSSTTEHIPHSVPNF